MAMTIVMALEGVLAGRSDDIDLTQEQVDPMALVLYNGLSRFNKVLLATNYERPKVDHWCRIYGLTLHQGVDRLDERTVRRLRAAGFAPDLYIDHDGARVAAALREGVATMLHTRPLYARPGHRPDLVTTGLQKNWGQIVAESQAQRSARALPQLDDEG